MADPRSKIPQDSWGRILDSAKAILKYLHHIEVQYGGSKTQDSSTKVLENLGSWIRHIETQYGFNISIWSTLKTQDSSPSVLENLGSWIRNIQIQYGWIQYFNMADIDEMIMRCW